MKISGVESCISLAKKDKHSSWAMLTRRIRIKSWKQILRGGK